MRRVWLVGSGVLAIVAVLGGAVGGAAEKADATLTLSEGSVAVGIGFSWGSGTLHYKGAKHRFKVNGIAVNTVGASKLDAEGYVYDLKRLEDFDGTYTAVVASGAAGAGAGITTMKNGKGVRITLHSISQGLQATAGPEGVKFTLEK